MSKGNFGMNSKVQEELELSFNNTM